MLLELVKEAKIGSIVPVYKELNGEIDALDYFRKLSNYGNKKNSIFMQGNEKSFGSADPCLMVIGRGNGFEIAALNNLGRKFLSFIKKDFKFCDKAIYKKDKIYGTLTAAKKQVSEQEKLKQKSHLDILRAIAFKFKPASKPFSPYCGLFGTISNDFIAQNENLQVNEDKLNDPDYILYFLDNMFIVDHKEKKTYFVANALVTDNKNEDAYKECNKKIGSYEKTASKKAPKARKYKKKNMEVSYDTSNEEFTALMRKLKNDVSDGNILYAFPSRLVTANCNAEPLDVYAKLKDNNPGSTLCFINDGSGITISSGAESFLSVHDRTIEFSIYTSRIQRGISKDQMDNDNKHEALLKTKESEIFFNLMLLDDARNSVARVSEKGTRFVEKMFEVNKLPRYQYVSSTVKGTLKESLDALHALFTTANSAGIPQSKSMQLLSRVEKAKRPLNSCSLVCLSPDKELYGMQIEPMRIKKGLACIRAVSRVFNGSNDEKELMASDEKACRFLEAIRSAGGVK